ncbi:ZP4 protein, partial [Atractosteus spatula]|nr:ZP4 protein [Atractosteus spatula]
MGKGKFWAWTGPLVEIKVRSSSGSLVSALDTPSCGYSVTAGLYLNTLTILYTGCHVRLVKGQIKCKKFVYKMYSINPLLRRSSESFLIYFGCKLPRSHRLACGPGRTSPAHCVAKGCCVDPETSSCYYPLEECTADKHFVFAVPRTISVPPVDPASLVIAGNASCTPVICTSEFAIFKFPVTGCGTHAFVVGETTIYLAEVETRARRNMQSYGVITRDSPFRLPVECRCSEGNLASSGYLVKSPYLPFAVLSEGVFGVQLQIATGESCLQSNSSSRGVFAPPPPPPRGLTISCSEVCMTVTLPAGPLEEIKVEVDLSNLISLGCKIPRSQHVSCGPERIHPYQCLAKGCCVDPETSSCYYPLEECTADGHFVFAVHRTISVPPVDPASLVIAGNASCTPVICTPEFAIFKFPITGCRTHAFVVGETTIYLAEVESLARQSILSYGVVTRDSPFRLLVECRYAEGRLASSGYLVKSPHLPSAVLSQGVFGVQLRIATVFNDTHLLHVPLDESYSRFYPQYHRPLRLLLGNPVYLELRLLNAPDPNLVLLVHYCVAYPRSGQAVWVLLYDGCPNPLDYGHTSTLHIHSKLPLPKHHRRFHIQTFQFLDSTSYSYINEEIYFMCSTEVCLPSERQCVEGCFDGRKIPVLENPDADRRCVRTPCPGKDEGPRD